MLNFNISKYYINEDILYDFIDSILRLFRN